MRNQKGITLIALVITIIVLLILAGVSIAMLAGDNGVLTKASDSKIVNAIGAKKDEVALAAAEALSDYYDSIYLANNSTTYEDSGLVEKVKEAIDTVKAKADPDVEITTLTKSGNEYTFQIKSKAKATLYTDGKIEEKGGIKWTDHFKAE